MIITILAILKAGGAYLPVDEGYPASRIRYMLDDARPVLAVTNIDFTTMLGDALTTSGTPILVIDDPTVRTLVGTHDDAPVTDTERTMPLRVDNTAYVIYTSGSTGQPKGVTITHGNVTDLVGASWFDSGHERVLVHSPVTFDASTYEIFVPLLRGGTAPFLSASLPFGAGA